MSRGRSGFTSIAEYVHAVMRASKEHIIDPRLGPPDPDVATFTVEELRQLEQFADNLLAKEGRTVQ